jgi:outer membrane protein OmpA-like peptidoglycan-associated protein
LIDDRRCDLYKIAQENQLQIASMPIPASAIGMKGPDTHSNQVGLNVVVADNGNQFTPGSAGLTPSGRNTYSQIGKLYTPAAVTGSNSSADQVAAANQRAVLVVVHATTQDVTSGQDLTTLTQERARAVAQSIAASGVNPNNIYYQGVGDAAPVTTDNTPDGQAAQNSVQIIDVPKSEDLPTLLANQTSLPPASAVAGSAPSREAGARKYGVYDFGGTPVSGAPEEVALGAPLSSGWSFVQSANAAAPMMVAACTADHPHNMTPVTNLATGEDLPVRDDIQSFYGAPWAGGLHGNLVDILDDVVPADSSSPVPAPRLQVYRDYHSGDNSPNFSKRVAVNVYRSQTETLYRMFVDGPVQCMDLVVPAGTNTGTGTVYYNHHNELYVASGAFKLQRD